MIDMSYMFGYCSSLKKPVVTVNFKKNFKGRISREFEILPQKLSNLTASAQDTVYTAKANKWKSPIVIMDTNGKKLKAGSDYEKQLSYYLDENLAQPATAGFL